MVHEVLGSRLNVVKQMLREPSPLSVLLASVTPHDPPMTWPASKPTPASSLSHTWMLSSAVEPAFETVNVTVTKSPAFTVVGPTLLPIVTSGTHASQKKERKARLTTGFELVPLQYAMTVAVSGWAPALAQATL